MSEINLTSQMPHMFELRTRLIQDKEQYETLYKQYTALINIVEAADKSEDLPADFLPGIKQNVTEITQGIANMAERLGYIDAIINQYEVERRCVINNEPLPEDFKRLSVDELVTLVFDSLGINPGVPTASAETEEAAE